jgi:hypothetical protein
LSELIEDLIEPRYLLFGFLEMGLEARSKVPVRGFVDELRQRLNDLVFGVINVLQPVEQKIVHRLDVF